jgi:hypothetical protein
MFIPTEKIAPPRPNSTFNDNIVEHADLKKREEDDRWVRHIIKALAGALRELGCRTTPEHDRNTAPLDGEASGAVLRLDHADQKQRIDHAVGKRRFALASGSFLSLASSSASSFICAAPHRP